MLGIFSLILASCASKKATQQVTGRTDTPTLQRLPSWVTSKPMMPGYYVGVGTSRIRPGNQDHIRAAREIALKDLAGEIKVNISSSSILARFESNYRMQEHYMSEIRAKTNLDLEDYEQVEVHEENGLYAVLYRLNRDAYWAKIAARRNQAMEKAWQAISEARIAWDQGEIQNSLYRYVVAIEILQPHMDQELSFRSPEGTVDLGTLIPTDMATMLGSISLQMNPATLVIRTGTAPAITILATVRNRAGQIQPARGLPIQWRTQFSAGKTAGNVNISGENQTDQLGQAQAKPPAIVKEETLVIAAEATPSRWDFQTNIPQFLSNYLMGFTKTATARMSYEKPTIFLRATETNLGQPVGYPQVTLTVRQFLEKNGFQILSDSTRADLLFDLLATTEAGTQQGGIFIAYGTLHMKAIRRSDQQVIFTQILERLKGADLNFEAAGRKSFSTNRDEILKRLERFLGTP